MHDFEKTGSWMIDTRSFLGHETVRSYTIKIFQQQTQIIPCTLSDCLLNMVNVDAFGLCLKIIIGQMWFKYCKSAALIMHELVQPSAIIETLPRN